MDPLDTVKLSACMAGTKGTHHIKFSLMDGLIIIYHPTQVQDTFQQPPSTSINACTSAICFLVLHSAFNIGMLIICRDRKTPANCREEIEQRQ